jgi:8-oxo-dGTP diphosphatase
MMVLSFHQHKLNVLLVQRKYPPFQGHWALPGGFVEGNETFAEAAARELEEETSMCNMTLLPIKPFDTPDRDPRGRTITMLFFGFTTHPEKAQAGSDAKLVSWWPLEALPELAFDHYQIITEVQTYIQSLYSSARSLLEAGKPFSVAKFLKMTQAFCHSKIEMLER